MACHKSIQVPKSTDLCMYIYHRQFEFRRFQNIGPKIGAFSRYLDGLYFHLRYVGRFWRVIESARSYTGFHPISGGSQNPSESRKILGFNERRVYSKCAGNPAHFDFWTRYSSLYTCLPFYIVIAVRFSAYTRLPVVRYRIIWIRSVEDIFRDILCHLG